MKQNLLKQTVYLALGGLLAACQSAPRVVAELQEQLPAHSLDSISIFRITDSVPSTARKIGTVKVVDGGLMPTKTCLFPNMLALAVKKTAESGGNGFKIDEHKYPRTNGSTCHRIWGTMYLMPDSLVTADTRTSLQEIEQLEDAEQEIVNRYVTRTRDRLLKNPKDVVKINAGPSWIVSEMQMPTGTYKRKIGFGLGVDYQHIWRSGFGIGLNYLYYGTSFNDAYGIRMHYIGPSVLVSLKTSDKWRYDASLGIGYSRYTEQITGRQQGISFKVSGSENRVGTMVQLGIEYMLSKKVGIGIQSDAFVMSLKEPDDYKGEYDFYGIRRIDAQIGLRFYL